LKPNRVPDDLIEAGFDAVRAWYAAHPGPNSYLGDRTQMRIVLAAALTLHDQRVEQQLRVERNRLVDELAEERASHNPLLRCILVKAAPDRDLYIGWSNVVEAPTGMWTRTEALAYGFPRSRLNRADHTGTSSMVPGSGHGTTTASSPNNAAGSAETASPTTPRRCSPTTKTPPGTCWNRSTTKPRCDVADMQTKDVPVEYIEAGADAIHAHYAANPDDESEENAIRILLAAVLPLHEQQVRKAALAEAEQEQLHEAWMRGDHD